MKQNQIYGSAAEENKVNYADVRLPFIHRFVIMMIIVVRRIVVVLKTPSRIGDRIIDSRNIYDKMSASTWFPTPDPTMPDFLALIEAYENAAAADKAGSSEAEAKLHEAWNRLFDARTLLRNYVQNVCVKNHDNAEKIALSAGMSIKKPATRDVQDFSVKAVAGGGADLSSKVKAARSFNEWQCTTDPADPMGWYKKLIDSTIQARTKVMGFTPGNTVYFRHRSILRSGPTPWSEIISIVITK